MHNDVHNGGVSATRHGRIVMKVILTSLKTGEMSGNVPELWLTRHHYEHHYVLHMYHYSVLYHCFIVCDTQSFSAFLSPGQLDMNSALSGQ